jgi:ABC-type multidrug transport system permease subunit
MNYISTSSISIFLIVNYWIFEWKQEYAFMEDNKDRFLRNAIGNNFGIVLLFLETILSRVRVVKFYASIGPIAVLLYIFWVWVTRYIFQWEWPLKMVETYFSRDISVFNLIIHFIILAAVGSGTPVIVYAIIAIRDYIANKLKRKPKTQVVTV